MSLYDFQLFIDSNNVFHSWVAFLSQRVFCHNFLEQSKNASNTEAENLRRATTENAEHEKQIIGLLAVLCACFSSGFAGVFFEMLVKTGAQPSVVIRNLQLGIFSLMFGAFVVIYTDLDAVTKDGFFQGYNYLVVIIIILQVNYMYFYLHICLINHDRQKIS